MLADHVQTVNLMENVDGAVIALGGGGEVHGGEEGGGRAGAGFGVDVHGEDIGASEEDSWRIGDAGPFGAAQRISTAICWNQEGSELGAVSGAKTIGQSNVSALKKSSGS